MKLNLEQKKFIDEVTLQKIIKIGINFGERLNTIDSKCIDDFSEDKLYLKGEACYKDGYIYRAVVSTEGAWVDSRWVKVGDDITELDLDTIKGYLNLSQQDLDNLQNLIDDAQISLTKTHSSSKIYADIQQCLDDSKTYTLKEINKLSGASYKVVTSTSEMISESIIYLLPNATNYDMYIVEVDGTKTRIGDMDVNLDDYLTKTEIETDYLKKTDADGKYATITTVDGKVNKTDIVDNLTSTDTDKPLSANQGKILKDEVDLKANDSDVIKKTDISTTIDSSSTNDTVPTTKSVWESLYKICDSQVLVDANNPTSKICMADLTTLNTPAKEGMTSAESSLIISIEGRGYWNGQISIHMASPEVYVRSVRDTSTWTKWRKLCSTNIKDVPVTTITNNLASAKVSLSNIDSYATYYVKNGTCYVTIWSMKILAACSVETIFNNLPKSAVGATCPLCNGEESFAQVFISPNSKVIAFNASAATINKNGYCSFSYPVAES